MSPLNKCCTQITTNLVSTVALIRINMVLHCISTAVYFPVRSVSIQKIFLPVLSHFKIRVVRQIPIKQVVRVQHYWMWPWNKEDCQPHLISLDKFCLTKSGVWNVKQWAKKLTGNASLQMVVYQKLKMCDSSPSLPTCQGIHQVGHPMSEYRAR